jgi:large subunit ribosomal protein L23
MLLKPLITEKSMADAANKSYTFVVSLADTKTTIRQYVEKTFGVNVVKVHTSIFKGKTYRTGRKGLKATGANWKKATVTIKPDQKIDLFAVPQS